MRILIDARMMEAEISRGIGRYVEELVLAIQDMIDPKDRIVLLIRGHNQLAKFNANKFEHILCSICWYGWKEQMILPLILRRAKADLIHYPHWNIPLFMRTPFVVTIHDLINRHSQKSTKISLRHPWLARIKYAAYRVVLFSAIHRSSAIIVPTQYVKDDILNFYSVSADKVIVAGEGLSSFPSPDASRIPNAPFLLFVGSAYPHKRLDLLFSTWKMIHERYPKLCLIVVGEKDVFMQRFLNEESDRIVFLGRVTDAELAALYQHATAFVFPTSDEGFGLPPLEALSFGCPVVSSDAACLPDVLPKQGVFFFQNGSQDDMIRALEAVLSDIRRARRQAEQGREEIRQRHDWKKTVGTVINVYQTCLGGMWEKSKNAKNPFSGKN